MIELEFLRYCLGSSDTVPFIKEKEWDGVFRFCLRQSLVGIGFAGVQRIAESRSYGNTEPRKYGATEIRNHGVTEIRNDGNTEAGNHGTTEMTVPKELLLKWFALAEQIKQRNQLLNQRCVELVGELQQDGFLCCILKGQGNAIYYGSGFRVQGSGLKEEGSSLALLRQPGDIDVWLEGGRERIMDYVRKKYGCLLERYHHVEIPPVNGIPVEVHFFPSYMRSPWRNKRLQKWFAEQAEKQFANKVTLPGVEGQISIPTAEFNTIYQLQHMFSHLFTEGFGLRQVVDYYFLLQSAKDKLIMDNGQLKITLKYLGLEKFAGAMMWVMREVLCLEDKYMIAEPNEKEGLFLLSEIMQSGNMGHYDTRLGKSEGESIVHRYFRMTRRNMRFIKYFPEEALCEPLFRTWFFFWRQKYNKF